MEKKIINPVSWQEGLGFVQANEITNPKRFMFTAGQVSVDAEGNLLYPLDMEKQLSQILDNMVILLAEANLELSDVVKFTYYTTDIQAFIKADPKVLIGRLAETGCKPATSLIGVSSLFHPDCIVEIEATAAN